MSSILEIKDHIKLKLYLPFLSGKFKIGIPPQIHVTNKYGVLLIINNISVSGDDSNKAEIIIIVISACWSLSHGTLSSGF